MSRPFTTKWPATCNCCGDQIPRGTKAEWDEGRTLRHVRCPEDQAAAAERRHFDLRDDYQDVRFGEGDFNDRYDN